MYENRICCDYRDGKVTKEELDKCSTCDVNCVINNGLSEASKEQLKHKSGEQIVDEDIAKQMEKIKMYSITKSKTTKRYAIFICLVYIFVFKDWMEQYIPVVGYMDELFVVLSIPCFCNLN